MGLKNQASFLRPVGRDSTTARFLDFGVVVGGVQNVQKLRPLQQCLESATEAYGRLNFRGVFFTSRKVASPFGAECRPLAVNIVICCPSSSATSRL